MVVVGDKISPDQAAEIIFRTSDLEFTCNDNIWRKQLHTELGVLPEKDSSGWYLTDQKKLEEIQKSLGILELKYLHNEQIASSNIYGPYGWCSWDGTIGCDHNIGSWPSVKNLFKEWKIIASTWPFLKLRCQLWSDEEDEFNSYSDSEDENIKQSRPLV